MQLKDLTEYDHNWAGNEKAQRGIAALTGNENNPRFRVTQKIAASLVLGHELGHADHFFGMTQEEVDAMRFDEFRSLPFPGKHPSRLDRMTDNLAQNWRTYNQMNDFAKKGIFTPEELQEAQGKAYRLLPTEVRADEFAARLLRLTGQA